MTKPTQFKPTQRSEGAAAAGAPASTQNAVNTSIAKGNGKWAEREEARQQALLAQDQAMAAITCGVRGGR